MQERLEQMEQMDAKKRKILLRLFVPWLIIILAAAQFIYYERAQMNYENRAASVTRQLYDYPRLLNNYLHETDELFATLETANHTKMAEQAAFLFDHDETHAQEADRLEWIREILGMSEISVLSPQQAQEARDANNEEEYSVAFSPLRDGRMIMLRISLNNRNYRYLDITEQTFLMIRLKAGERGYFIVDYDDEFIVYPEDENSEAIWKMVNAMMDAELLDYEGLKREAEQSKDGIALQRIKSIATDEFADGLFSMIAAAYADVSDFVISIEYTSDLERQGEKRTWSLIVLTVAVFVALGWTLWRTRLYLPDSPYKTGRRLARLRCSFLLLLACFVLTACVVDIQLLANVNQDAESTVASVSALKNILSQEKQRAEVITAVFDETCQARAETAARFLAANPDQINVDTLKALDQTMNGRMLQVLDTDGNLTMTDGVFQPEAADSESRSVYRATIADGQGKTTGFVDYYADHAEVDAMLAETTIEGVLKDLNVIDVMDVVAVRQSDKKTIVASSRSEWTASTTEDLGIDTSSLYNGYEGVLLLNRSETYASVFAWEDNLIIVSYGNSSIFDFIRRILLMLGVLLVLTFLLYNILFRQMYALQAAEAQEQAASPVRESDHPPLRFFMERIMLAIFCLSACLFLITENNPTGLTYKIVRGIWIRGLNSVTITSILIVYSAFVTVYLLLKWVLDRRAAHLSPRGITLCQLTKSASRYIGTITLAITTLSMVGVDTTTLVGGAGVMALVFTLGANSLISDVLVGFFILFEGNIEVGDMVTIEDFTGVVKEISIRSTVLMELASNNIKIVNNGALRNLVNHNRNSSTIYLDFSVSHSVGLVSAEQILQENLEAMAKKYERYMIGKPRYLGVHDLPELTEKGEITPYKVRIAVDCREQDRYFLMYSLKRDLLWVANMLMNDTSDVGIEGCKLNETPEG